MAAPSQIPLFDIRAQHAKLKGELRRAVQKTLDSCSFVLGEEGRLFEEELAARFGVPHAIGVSSGTSALHLALQAVGVGPGDGVLTSPFTFIGTTIGVLAAGAEIQFADIDPVTLNLSPDEAASRVRPNTRALLPVHLFGYPADMDGMLKVARRKGLRVVEDCAQSHLTTFNGATVGGIGDVGCLSFYVTKNLGAAGDAGACVTRDAKIDERLRVLRNNGSNPKAKYEHLLKGYNARLDELQAAVLRVKLKHLAEWTRLRRERAALYRELLADLPLELPPADGPHVHTYHLFVLRSQERDRLQKHLAAAGVSTAIYYPIPLHLQPAYKDLGFRAGQFPNAEKAAREVIALPLYPELPLAAVRRVAAAIRSFYSA